MHRKRPRLRQAVALLTGALLTSASLGLAALPASAADPEAIGKPAAAPTFQQVTLAKG
ncbi:hypothetical protein G3I39_04910, partial [Streptomyces fulvissimus]|nr:hypothetical protein [Streptomyces microflavus]